MSRGAAGARPGYSGPVRTTDPPKLHADRAFFDAIAHRYDRVYGLSGAASRERMAAVVSLLPPASRVLSLGLGTGRELPALLDAGHQVIGLDVSPKMIALCNRRSRTVPIVEACFWEPLRFEDASFDAVLALHGTLAHPPTVNALGELAREIRRVLRRGGRFVAEVPAAHAFPETLASAQDGISLRRTARDRFTHHDDVADVALEGIVLDAAGWRAAFGEALSVTAQPLGDAEYRLVASVP